MATGFTADVGRSVVPWVSDPGLASSSMNDSAGWSVPARFRPLLVGALVVIGAGCGASSGSDQGADATKRAAEHLGVEIENSPIVFQPSQMTATNVAAAAKAAGAEVLVANSVTPDDAASIYQWTDLVVRLEGTVNDAGGGQHTVAGCWRYHFEGRFLRGDPRSVACPTNDDTGSAPTPIIAVPVDLPADTITRLEQVLTALTDQDSIDSVRAKVITAFPELHADNIDVEAVDGQTGVSITDHSRACILGRHTTVAEVWASQSPADTRGDGGCSGFAAARGDFKNPP